MPLIEPSIFKKQRNCKLIRVTDRRAQLTKTIFKQQGTSVIQNRNKSQSPINNSRIRSATSKNKNPLNQTPPQGIHPPVPIYGARGSPILKLPEFSGDPLEWSECSGLFDAVIYQKQISDTKKMQCLKTSLTGQAKLAISRVGISSQTDYQTWDMPCEKHGRSDVLVNAQFKKIPAHPLFGHNLLRELLSLQM